MRLGLLFLCCATIATTARAQNLVGGIVVDSATHSPFHCIEVTLEDTSGHKIGRTRTARDGFFQFDSPERGRYRFKFDAVGAAPWYGPVMSLDRDSTLERQFVLAFGRPLDLPWSQPSDTAADAPPRPIRTSKGPLYPPRLRAEFVDGEVLIQLVIDSTGAVEQNSVRVLRSTDSEFAHSVEEYLHSARFSPARRDHRPVCSFVYLPFQFAVTR